MMSGMSLLYFICLHTVYCVLSYLELLTLPLSQVLVIIIWALIDQGGGHNITTPICYHN